jgi:hypothetical protein
MTSRSKFLIIGAVFAGLWVIGHATPQPAPAPAPQAAPAANWIPTGFSATTDPTVAYRWLAKDQFSCSLDSCWGMEVVPRDGCPASLYVEVSVSDSSGAAVGYSNDTAGAVQPGQHAKLVFENTEATGKTARLTNVTCR